ncbi:hypothetical protein OURE66S_00618 [Oligella ureolytica]
MVPFAMIGIVSPWLAAIIMFVSSLWVGFMGVRLFKRFRREFEATYALSTNAKSLTTA